MGWEPGGFASGKGFPSTACIGGGERCVSAIKAKPDVRGAPGRMGRFVGGRVARFAVAATTREILLSCPWFFRFPSGARSRLFIRVGT